MASTLLALVLTAVSRSAMAWACLVSSLLYLALADREVKVHPRARMRHNAPRTRIRLSLNQFMWASAR